MDRERELRSLAAVSALRGILTSEGFKEFKLKDGLVGWDKEELEELVNYVKRQETPATVELLSDNSRTRIKLNSPSWYKLLDQKPWTVQKVGIIFVENHPVMFIGWLGMIGAIKLLHT